MSVKISELSDFDTVTDANKGAWLTLLSKSGQPTSKRVKLLGTDSEQWRQAEHSDANLRIQAVKRAGKQLNLKSEQIEEIGLRRLSRVTIEWEGFSDESGNPAPCTPENVFAVYRALPLVARQVEDFVIDPANFGQEGEKLAPMTAEGYMAEIAGN
jgi:hypothetical protein